MENQKPEISVILPCRNEEQGLAFCLDQIKKTLKENNLSAEIIVSDSSVDKSPEIAKKAEVILIKHDKEGYGMAYIEAFKLARGKYIFMADADASYSFAEIPNFISELKNGYDFVIGNRFAGEIQQGAMIFSHRYIGNPVLSFILRLFFHTKIRDSQCGVRAIKKSALGKLNLQTGGMEFASEMIIKALKNNLKIKELPVNYYCRKGKSKMRSLVDAWKHLRFMLLYSPLFLFFIPGIILFFLGISFIFQHNMFLSSLMAIIGYQLVVFSAFAKVYSITHLNEKNKTFEKLFKYITIENASIAGFGIAIFGVVFGLKNPIIALTFLVIGIQTVFSSFMLSILGIKEK
jgi:glycosyltransferase involved in cell wall biosynthesis